MHSLEHVSRVTQSLAPAFVRDTVLHRLSNTLTIIFYILIHLVLFLVDSLLDAFSINYSTTTAPRHAGRGETSPMWAQLWFSSQGRHADSLLRDLLISPARPRLTEGFNLEPHVANEIVEPHTTPRHPSMPAAGIH